MNNSDFKKAIVGFIAIAFGTANVCSIVKNTEINNNIKNVLTLADSREDNPYNAKGGWGSNWYTSDLAEAKLCKKTTTTVCGISWSTAAQVATVIPGTPLEAALKANGIWTYNQTTTTESYYILNYFPCIMGRGGCIAEADC